jgi:hypothetical protein
VLGRIGASGRIVVSAAAKTTMEENIRRVGYDCFLLSFFPFLPSFAIGFGM